MRELSLPSFGVIGVAESKGSTTESVPPALGKKADMGGKPFIISEALPVIPAKLVKKVERGEFVDMADFLKDNIEAERRRLTGGMNESPLARSSRREVPDLLSWLQSYSMFAAVVSNKYPNKTRELWAYQAIMLAESRRCGGRGWSLYDAAFRQQMASYEEVDFSRINQSLYATTFLAYRGGGGTFCQSCLASDHSYEDCALHPSRGLPMVRMGEVATRDQRVRRPEARKEKGRKQVSW